MYPKTFNLMLKKEALIFGSWCRFSSAASTEQVQRDAGTFGSLTNRKILGYESTQGCINRDPTLLKKSKAPGYYSVTVMVSSKSYDPDAGSSDADLAAKYPNRGATPLTVEERLALGYNTAPVDFLVYLYSPMHYCAHGCDNAKRFAGIRQGQYTISALGVNSTGAERGDYAQDRWPFYGFPSTRTSTSSPQGLFMRLPQKTTDYEGLSATKVINATGQAVDSMKGTGQVRSFQPSL